MPDASSLNIETIRAVASAAYQAFSLSSTASCHVLEPCKLGSANAVYELRFSDGTAWVILILFPHSEPSMRRNVNGHLSVASNTSIPIPKVHSYALDSNKALGHPYMIMDFAQGTRLSDVWYDQSWWTVSRSKARTLESLARHMVQLSSLKFTDIGGLERDEATDEHFIAAFSSRLEQCPMAKGPDYAIGPFRTQNEFFKALLNSAKVDAPPWPELALMQFFTSTLLDPRYNDGPFTLCHPDLDCQNIFIDNTTGEVTAIIDWDGICALPRQLGALSYPSWLIVDWNPWVYESYKDTNHFDHADALHEYRIIYLDAIRAYGGDVLADTTLNSHIASAIYATLSQLHQTNAIVCQLGKLYCGSARPLLDLCSGAHDSEGWYARDRTEMVRMPEFIYEDEVLLKDDPGPAVAGEDDKRADSQAPDAALVITP